MRAGPGFSYVFRSKRTRRSCNRCGRWKTFAKEVHTDTSVWTGKDERLDDQEFNYAELKRGHLATNYTVTMTAASMSAAGWDLYNQPSKGLYHNPYNCYHTHGFNLLGRKAVSSAAEGR